LSESSWKEFTEIGSWFEKIRERQTRSKILTRLDRLRLGNFGDCKSLDDGVSELRIHYGPGLRIYYARTASQIVLLLVGGDKGSQNRDIVKAKEYFRDFQMREKKYGKK
jgi:putative addiction module killer protein